MLKMSVSAAEQTSADLPVKYIIQSESIMHMLKEKSPAELSVSAVLPGGMYQPAVFQIRMQPFQYRNQEAQMSAVLRVIQAHSGVPTILIQH